jgi:hypothetical protein
MWKRKNVLSHYNPTPTPPPPTVTTTHHHTTTTTTTTTTVAKYPIMTALFQKCFSK